MQKVITAYRFDENGYYMGIDPVVKGFLPPDDTTLKPEIKDGYWPRFVDGAWTNEKMPESAEDFVDAGIVIEHTAHTPHAEALRELMFKFAPQEHEAGKLFLNRDDETNALSVVRVPELTEKEKKQKAADEAAEERRQKIADLKDRMFEAFMLGDDDAIAEIKAEYRSL